MKLLPAREAPVAKAGRRRRMPDLHPLLLAAFPVLFLYSRNADAVAPSMVAGPLVLSVACAGLLYGGLAWLWRDSRRAAVVSSCVVLAFFSYGHLADTLHDEAAGPAGHVHAAAMAVCAGAIAIATVLCVNAARVPRTRPVTAAAAAIVAFTAVTGAVGYARAEPWWTAASEAETRRVPAEPHARDIYFVVLDRYPGRRTLEAQFGFDNTPFLDALRARGFYVASDAIANYPRTAHSLAATLNLTHLDDVAHRHGSDAGWDALYGAIRDHEVARVLQGHGYSYVHIGSWWEPTNSNPAADANLAPESPSAFSRALARTTMLRASGLDTFDFRREHHSFAVQQFDRLPEVALRDRANFVFAHVLLPHEPYVFDRDGSFVDARTEHARGETQSFVRQLSYANARILRFLDAILDVPPERTPLVILQADEGPHPDGLGEPGYRWADAPPSHLAHKFPILSAFLLPGLPGTGWLDAGISPVNTFRLVFDLYFGRSYGPLADSAHVYASEDRPLELTEVTGRVFDALERPGSVGTSR